MKFKLTKTEFKSIHDLLQQITLLIKPQGIEQILLHSLLFSIYKKLYSKALDTKKQYSFSLSDEQACAWYLFFSKTNVEMDDYTVNMVLRINNSIHQKFAK